MLGEGFDPFERFVPSGTLPVREELLTVEVCPLFHEPELPARQRAGDQRAIDSD
jgi:hypothetical protein